MKGYKPLKINNKNSTKIQTQSKIKPAFLELGFYDPEEGGEEKVEQIKIRSIKSKT